MSYALRFVAVAVVVAVVFLSSSLTPTRPADVPPTRLVEMSGDSAAPTPSVTPTVTTTPSSAPAAESLLPERELVYRTAKGVAVWRLHRGSAAAVVPAPRSPDPDPRCAALVHAFEVGDGGRGSLQNASTAAPFKCASVLPDASKNVTGSSSWHDEAPLLLRRSKNGGAWRVSAIDMLCGNMPPVLTAAAFEGGAAYDDDMSMTWLRGRSGNKRMDDSDDSLPATAARAAASTASVALLLSGEMRRFVHAAPAQKRMWIEPNEGPGSVGGVDVFAATWPTPLDSIVNAYLLSYTREQLARAFGTGRLAGVRVHTYHPSRSLLSLGAFSRGNTAPMMFLAESVWFLAEKHAKSGQYKWYIRARFDVVPATIISFGRGGAVKVGSRSYGLGDGDRSAVPRAVSLLMHHTSLCCVNDWFAVGTPDAMRALSTVYSSVVQRALTPIGKQKRFLLSFPGTERDLLAFVRSGTDEELLATNSSHVFGAAFSKRRARALLHDLAQRKHCHHEFASMRFQARGSSTAAAPCYAERCIATELLRANASWALIDAEIKIGKADAPARNSPCGFDAAALAADPAAREASERFSVRCPVV